MMMVWLQYKGFCNAEYIVRESSIHHICVTCEKIPQEAGIKPTVYIHCIMKIFQFQRVFLDSSDLTVSAKVYGVIPNSAGKERNTSACDNTLQYPAYMDLMTVLSRWEMHSWHQQSCNRATAPLHFKEPQNQFLYTVYLIIYSI